MLGRLKMTAEDCIVTYMSLISSVFQKERRLHILNKVQGRFDAAVLETAIQNILKLHGLSPHELLRDVPSSNCKV